MSGDSSPHTQVGRKVLFVGGPEAGNVRVIPESFGDLVQGDGDYIYRIWPFQMQGSTAQIFFAYADNQHPMNMLRDMWREYSPAAQIRGKMDGVAQTYQKVKPSP